MAKKSIHITPLGKNWQVKRAGSSRPISTHLTQAAAENAGRPIAQKDKTELFIHNRKGQIRDRDSYGNDPFPPRDTKH
ncbi:MAG: DUF2188 domain-containing protein [candidate division Zixibacteria bacterium]|nr:DUF2188 domain-containing protein [candidate division Zixibacteria bacterium]MDH3939021.1 DUF2188 domain-containing protein [candidate division Zixibacteria bacterium]MDH4035378.1 DUF2188 domain-containing protein [candidate division Zixibacteria bacterium]